jgi:hypothetical protein
MEMIATIPDAAYPVIGFAVTYIALEIGWHFTACKSGPAKPCIFKQAKAMVAGGTRKGGG